MEATRRRTNYFIPTIPIPIPKRVIETMKLNTQLLAIVLLVVAVAADSGCQRSCGEVEIPYPFGIGNPECYLDSRFNLTCDINSKLYRGNIAVLHIDIPKSEIEVSSYIAKNCSNKKNIPYMQVKWFTISSEANKFVTIGCDSYGILKSTAPNLDTSSTGCLTICYSRGLNIENGTCSGGRGCCQVDIPPSMKNISLEASSFFDHHDMPCTYSFIVKVPFEFSRNYLAYFPYKTSTMVLDWTIGTTDCGDSCKDNSDCVYDTDSRGTRSNFRCNCSLGYEGNPYTSNGCTDINECIPNPCKSGDHCKNTNGSRICSCPKWQYRTKDGGCQEIIVTVLGVGAAIICLFAGTFSYLRYQKRKLIKLKDEFYRENGGPELQKKLREVHVKIFTEDQLKKATNNYAESSILGRGGFGTVFKGTLEDNSVVAIKKPKKVDTSQIEEFFKEMVVLYQTSHKNVVELLGCCLETEGLLLVYEFVSHGTLSDFIKNSKGNANNETWETRLKIATEVAGALSYLHEDAKIPIIHRDIKSANILLDHNDTAKIADFGASKLVPHDQNEVATMVQITFGYLDPEYLQTNKLTDKSDVYSFGVVLAELITGQKALSFGPEENLATHFLSCIKNDSIVGIFQEGIKNNENQQEIKEVAIIASNCLRVKGEKRPSMKDVARQLEELLRSRKVKHEETQYLLGGEASFSIYEPGDSNKHVEMVQQIGHDKLKDSLIVFDDGR